jgi:LysR family transcriptional regulator, transcriptional activator of the cysJI operon
LIESGLRTFFEVVRSGSFSKAADVLFITQSAVSRRIKLLEERYGCLLIDRSGPVLQPTEAGRVVYEKARQMLKLENDLDKQIRALNERPPLAFACTRPFGSAYLPAILKRFMARYEGKVDFHVSLETPPNALQGLRDNEFDLIVLEHWDNIDFAPFVSVGIGTDTMVFVSAPSLGLPVPEIDVDDLIHHRLYRRREDCCSGKLLAHNMAAMGRDPGEFGNVFLYDDLHFIVESVLAGEGIAFISRSLVQGLLEEGRLWEHRVAGFTHERSRTLAYRQQNGRSEAFHYFLACILEAFSQADDGTSLPATGKATAGQTKKRLEKPGVRK